MTSTRREKRGRAGAAARKSDRRPTARRVSPTSRTAVRHVPGEAPTPAPLRKPARGVGVPTDLRTSADTGGVPGATPGTPCGSGSLASRVYHDGSLWPSPGSAGREGPSFLGPRLFPMTLSALPQTQSLTRPQNESSILRAALRNHLIRTLPLKVRIRAPGWPAASPTAGRGGPGDTGPRSTPSSLSGH